MPHLLRRLAAYAPLRSSRCGWSIVLLFCLSVSIATTSAATPTQTPGQLSVPLTVHERSGVARQGAVVTGGVPFPVGFLKDVAKLRVLDAAGKPVPTQASVMMPWRAPTYDDSVQWALVSFTADVGANATATYTLTDTGGSIAAPPATVALEATADAVTVSVAGSRFVVPKKGEALIASARLGNTDVIAGEGLRGIITAGDFPDRKLAKGSRHPTWHDDVTVEETGPLRTVLAIKGSHRPGDGQQRFYDFTTRLYFQANSPSVRIVHTIGNGTLDAKLIDQFRRMPVWPIEDASLIADLALPNAGNIQALAGGKPISATAGAEPLVVYQDSSGGEQWKDLKGDASRNWLASYTKGKTVRGVSFRGFKATHEGREIAAGNAADGAMAVSAPTASLAAAVRSFRVQHPMAISASSKQLRIGLFPEEFSEPFHLNNAQRKSWDVRLSLAPGGKAPDLQQLHHEHETLLLFRVDPAWMVRGGQAGAWPSGFATPPTGAPRPAAVKARADKATLDGTQTGWDWHGAIGGFNAGGGHWNQQPTMNNWLLHGDGQEFDVTESRALWSADFVAIHYKEIDLNTFWYWIKGSSQNYRESRIKLEAYPGYYNRDTWGLPDSGHMGMVQWFDYYVLTGDARAREAIEHLGIRARAMLWCHNYDDKNDGTGPMQRGIGWCKKSDADADPNFRLATRYIGWPLYDLAQHYRLTGDPQLLAEARNIARSFRNTARSSPIGFMTTQILEPGSKDGYGGQGNFEPYYKTSASQCYAHFQQALMCTGLVEYYLMSRDIEALDPLVAFGDFMTHRAMLKDAEGKRVGWSYAFGDYWGPYTLEQSQKSHFDLNSMQIYGWITHLTGRADYRDVTTDGVAKMPRVDSWIIPAQMAVFHPREDIQPPAAIADLKAEALGGGKVRLTWSTPAGDPTRYQVKWSTAKIFERVEGWPDRTEPLPQNKAEWEARAQAFNAKQVNFWAANNAPGAPIPSQAGATQSVNLEKLPAGRVHFAVKAWDAVDNMSDISNTVEVDVK